MPVTPLDAASDVLQRARNLLALDAPGTPETVREDLRRAALAFGLAALDTYMHWAIGKRTFSNPVPLALAKVEVPFGEMLRIANASVEARKDDKAIRPQVSVRHVLNKKLLGMTFQSPQNIENGLRMMGVTDCWKKISESIEPHEASGAIKKRLGDLAHRRNQIVHEGDLTYQDRPRQLKHEPVSAAYVVAELDWINSFILAIDEVAD